jgi:hypothetical protein
MPPNVQHSRKREVDASTAILASSATRLVDLKIGIERGVSSLVDLLYPKQDQPYVIEFTEGLTLDHIGVLLPCPWQEVKHLVNALGDPSAIDKAPSVLVSQKFRQRTGLNLEVNIHFVRFANPGRPKLEIFTVECDPLMHCDVRLREFELGNELHLAFQVAQPETAKIPDRVKALPLIEVMRGEHRFTGQDMAYYEFTTPFRRHVELLFPKR